MEHVAQVNAAHPWHQLQQLIFVHATATGTQVAQNLQGKFVKDIRD